MADTVKKQLQLARCERVEGVVQEAEFVAGPGGRPMWPLRAQQLVHKDEERTIAADFPRICILRPRIRRHSLLRQHGDCGEHGIADVEGSPGGRHGVLSLCACRPASDLGNPLPNTGSLGLAR